MDLDDVEYFGKTEGSCGSGDTSIVSTVAEVGHNPRLYSTSPRNPEAPLKRDKYASGHFLDDLF